MSVLVTGGAGYIGSHMTYALIDRGESVVVLDDLSTGVRSLVSGQAAFVHGDVGDQPTVRRIIADHGVDSVIHFAGSIVVPESVSQPLLYYANNTVASRSLIEACVMEGVKHFVFSSTAAVYGSPQTASVREDAPTVPINPYGRSKLATEWILEDTARAYEFSFFALRYFNVASADASGRTGQSSPKATHLIKRASQVALGRLPTLEIFGTDFPTPDGTGIRDYIHVTDLVEAHLLALDALRSGNDSGAFNCGYGHGFSVREIIAEMEKVTGRPLPVEEAPRRAGDPAVLIADSAKLKTALNWRPKNDDIQTIVRSVLDWERRFNERP